MLSIYQEKEPEGKYGRGRDHRERVEGSLRGFYSPNLERSFSGTSYIVASQVQLQLCPWSLQRLRVFSLLRWPGCHEAVSCFGALLLLTHLPQHYNSPCPCPPLSHWVNSRVSCKPQESPASSKDVTSCSNIWMSSPSLILLHALYVYRIAF